MPFKPSSPEVDSNREAYERTARIVRMRLDHLNEAGASRLIPWQIRYAAKYLGPILNDLADPPQLKEK